MVWSRWARNLLALCGTILTVSLFSTARQQVAKTLTNTETLPAATLASTVLRGVKTLDLSSAVRQKLGIEAELSGVVVTEVAENTPAAAAGLRRDDLIQAVEIYSDPLLNRVVRPDDFYRLAGKATHDVRLLVRHRIDDRYDTSTWVLVQDSGKDPRVSALRPTSLLSTVPSKAGSPDDEIQKTISNIRRGPHGAMPPGDVEPATPGGGTGMTVRNETGYTLYVYLSGPTSRTLEIPTGEIRDLRLAPGRYEIAVKASKPDVVPFYGVKNFGADTQYAEVFHVVSRKD
jgi:hypothetical protein